MINFSVRARKIENISYENPTKNISIHRNTHHRKKNQNTAQSAQKNVKNIIAENHLVSVSIV
jgi:hypothetical protein